MVASFLRLSARLPLSVLCSVVPSPPACVRFVFRGAGRFAWAAFVRAAAVRCGFPLPSVSATPGVVSALVVSPLVAPRG